MTKQELVKKLENFNVNPRYYAIGGELKDNAYNVEKLTNGTYSVYFSERGEKCGLKTFGQENEANNALFNNVIFDLEHGLDLSK